MEIGDVSKAVNRLDEDEKGTNSIPTPGGLQQLLCVNEPGLYALILGSRKPEAKAFKRWITHEVIPKIRKTGIYDARIPKTLPQALRAYADAEEQRVLLEAENAELRPKAELHDKFMSGKNTQAIGDVGKLFGIGRNTLFKELRTLGILMKDNAPYQKYVDRGYFTMIEVPTPAGFNTLQPRVTPKGVEYIAKQLGVRRGYRSHDLCLPSIQKTI